MKWSEYLKVDDKLVKLVKEDIYEKCDEDIERDVDILLEWHKQQAHYPKEIDRVWIANLLMRNKFRIEQTKKKLEAYYTLKGIYSDWFGVESFNPTTKSFKNVLECLVFVPMPKPLPDGGRLTICRLKNLNASLYNFKDTAKYVLQCYEVLTNYDYSCKDYVIIDSINAKFSHIKKIDPGDLFRAITLWQEVFSSRLGGIQLLNTPAYSTALVKIGASIIKDGKIRVHNNIEELCSVIPRDCLPEEYGGKQGKLEVLHEHFAENLVRNWDWIERRSKIMSDETLRIGSSHYNEEFGVNGSFKKINID